MGDPTVNPRSGVRPILIVDAANVVGSVPDGWWRDRKGAAERLRDRLAPLAVSGLGGLPGPIRIVLVVEGRARGVTPVDGVEVVDAPGSGDDAIVDAVRVNRPDSDTRETPDAPGITVVTADRELRSRVRELGALVLGPSTLHG
ncbi:NYN domain-containing protein [Gordonia desulfuricans]|uniref:NYN domain-containing protein n=1 Tax=Gordonia desulfuricans TaxID=89051 RepID=A0A7K3LN44_9ACTN|nr:MULTISPECIES: hypothetical protein [Gordonia]EMP15187.2 hypothetical protein ISGA_693 [Gordonia sp. NB41Y]NDK88967.1 NYN domain-containing protein [Gordonia desulfuricans]WLP90624.1 hypothetical protein Q9K23_24585 [Gordonia sp. NB41Y]